MVLVDAVTNGLQDSAMLSLVVFLLYPLAAFILYRLWPTDHQVLWWSVLASAAMMVWTRDAMKNARNNAIQTCADEDWDGNIEAATISNTWLQDGVLGFCITTNMVATLATAVTSVIGLFVPAGT